MKSWNILIAGVGGQGTLLTSKILGTLAQAAGYDVKVSEVHGMAQRGGSVLTYVKMAEKVHSPIIEPGEADVLLAFEQLEALRYAPFVRQGGCILLNTQKILPMPVISGKQPYPADIIEKLEKYSEKVVAVDAMEKALNAGNAKAVNTVMIGLLSSIMDIDESLWLDALTQCIPAKLLDVNLKAFHQGKR
jgi:indolepyruvate ferredoxin oxidoreductase, beta subunit